ncbi:MAG: FAD-dependent oxidoreductase [Chloroflexi bacterium]|nr:FAD-dependent oxidoreductase [Chloroflexota bacterium]
MPFINQPRPQSLKSLADASPLPFWLDDPTRPEAAAALTEPTTADLLIIGAGFTGLWTALLAREADPARDIVLVEAGEAASGASGRNGGFMDASLTHGFENGLQRWQAELASIIQLGYQNLAEIEATILSLGIDCDFLRSGELLVATEPYQVEDLRAMPAKTNPYGEKITWLERDQVLPLVNSPTYLGAVSNPNVALLNPAKLAWGLRKACLDLGVRLYEHTPATAINREGKSILVQTPHAQIRANCVALATNAFPPLLKRLSYYTVPVYDYVLVTEPLSSAQRDEIGWHGRQGISDAANQFHYYRTTADGRILWGGYDAIYYWNNGFGPALEHNPASFGRLAEHFFQTFPQLEGLHFTHAWGGAIDTCSRFSAFWGTTHAGQLAYSLGYTGLGVGATRFGAQVMLDLLNGQNTNRTKLEMVRSKPVPFPPEPLRSPIINLTRYSLDQADRNQGHRNLWLRALDLLGLGFDS